MVDKIFRKSRRPGMWFILTFLLLSTPGLLSPLACASGLDTLIISFRTDDFPSDNGWAIFKGNTHDLVAQNEEPYTMSNTLYRDTLLLPESTCYQWTFYDSKGDGLMGNGLIRLIWNDSIIFSADHFESQTTFIWNCQKGENCATAQLADPGTNRLDAFFRYNWLTIRPLFDTYFDVATISDCDTRIWIYDECKPNYPDGPAGALYYNDDFDNAQARIPQVIFRGGKSYFIRVDLGDSCLSAQLLLEDLQLKGGCLDESACNFDPLANLDNGSCFYGSCAPDLSVNQDVLVASVYLDTITNNDACMVEEGCLRGYGLREIIRFSTQIDNLGQADYIVGPPQAVSPHFSKNNCHDHWHYLGYAEYLLFDGDQNPLPIGFKNGFCALDTWCAEDSSYKYGCDYMGISAGCYDIYESDLLCQWIDVTDIADGLYTLVVRVNWNRLPDLFARSEQSYENNWAQVCIRLDRSQGNLQMEVHNDCPTFRDCLGFEFGQATIDCEETCGGVAHFGDADKNGRVETADLVLYLDYLLNPPSNWTKCLDLYADDHASIYDAWLLKRCLEQNILDEGDPYHTHCLFPAGLTVDQPGTQFRLSESTIEGAIEVEWKSPTDVMALELKFDGEDIDRIEYLGPEEVALSHNASKVLLISSGAPLPRKAEWNAIIRIWPTETGQPDICLGQGIEVVTDKDERTVYLPEDNCVDLLTTSVDAQSIRKQWRIWPNPASDFIRLTGVAEKPQSFTVLNMTGQEVLSFNPESNHKSSNLIHLNNLDPGVYFIKIGATQTGLKFVKF